MGLTIYVASSWRNERQPAVVRALVEAPENHDVYDFRNPAPGNKGFAWSDIDPKWKEWTVAEYVKNLQHPIARAGFALDMDALESCEACVLVMPCGRSAHLELGHAVGACKFTVVLLENAAEPELMYAMCDVVCSTLEEVLQALRAYEADLEEDVDEGEEDDEEEDDELDLEDDP